MIVTKQSCYSLRHIVCIDLVFLSEFALFLL
jgi:hypothetical protein